MPRKKTVGACTTAEVMQGYLAALEKGFEALGGRAGGNAAASLEFLKGLEPSKLLEECRKLGIEDAYTYILKTLVGIIENPESSDSARLTALDRFERLVRGAGAVHPAVEAEMRVNLSADDGLSGVPDDKVPYYIRYLREKRATAEAANEAQASERAEEVA